VIKRPERIVSGLANRLGLLGLIATIVVALLGFLAPAASASTLPHPQTRVAAIEHASGQPVGPSETILPGGSRPRAPSYDQDVTGSSVAAEGEASGGGVLARLRALNLGDMGSIGSGGGGPSGFTGLATAHGAEQLAAAGFDDLDVALIRAGSSYEQEAGGIAYVTQAGPDVYDLIVENDAGAIVTAHSGYTFDDLSGLARNYGWTGWP
jgi:hypothetical protein